MGYRKKRFYDNEAVLNYILIDLKEEEYKDVELDSFEIPTIISYLNDYGDFNLQIHALGAYRDWNVQVLSVIIK